MAKSTGKHAAHSGNHSSMAMTDKVVAPLPSHVSQFPEDKPHKKGGALKVLGIIVGILAVIYVAGGVWFTLHFMPKTTVDGKDVSLQSTDAVASSLTDNTAGYKTTISGDGIDLSLSGSDIDLKLDTKQYVSDAMSKVNAWAWPYEVTQTHTITVDDGASYDEAELTEKLSSAIDAVNQNATQPQNATIAFDDASAKFAVKDEVYGTAIDKDAAVKQVGDAVANLSSSIVLDETSLVQPTVTKDNASLATAATAANKFLAPVITLTLAGNTVATVDSTKIKDWVTLDDSLAASFDEGKVSEWTTGDLSSQLDTVGTTRTYTRPDGQSFTVSGGTYGWSIDGNTLAQNIIDAIKAGASTTIEIPTLSQAAVFTAQGSQDWGTRYVDVDLAAQYVRLYDSNGSCIWESACVSGNTSENNGTPTGVYTIQNKENGATLEGPIEASTGKPKWTSQVSYWMPFIGNSVGLHDATWRSSFGGTIYTSNGSHGCVNLPYTDAQQLFGMIQVGDVVVTHY